MKSFEFKSLEEFFEKFEFPDSKNTLLIFDIDGVFFGGFLDWRQVIGKISEVKLNTLRSILKKGYSCWIFTNRWRMFRNFTFVKQLINVLKEFSNEKNLTFIGSDKFNNFKLEKFAFILDAKKPGLSSQNTVKKAIENFDEIIYVSAKDFILLYTDKKLLSTLETKVNLDKLTFVDIR